MYPEFGVKSTAEDVATAFAKEINNKNGTLSPRSHSSILLMKYLQTHSDYYWNIAQWSRIRNSSCNFKARKSRRYYWIQRGAVGSFLVKIKSTSDNTSTRLKLSEAALKKEVPSANIRRLILDLSSLAQVRKAAAEVNAYSEPIHVCGDCLNSSAHRYKH